MVGKGVVVVGSQYGDEGKGKIVDYYCSRPFIYAVVRFNGGSNAGHTIVVDNKKYALHLLPSGMVYGKESLIGNGVVVSPQKLDKELEQFPEKKNKLKIDPRSHLVLPIHIKLDSYQEMIKKKGNIAAGTTKQGIGPCYADKASRIGIRWADIEIEEIFNSQLEYLYEYYNHLKDTLELPNLKDLKKELMGYYAKYKENFINVGSYIEEMIKNGKNILFEGAQATFLDIDHGVYPFSTSSTCLVSGASSGTGIGISYLNERIGVVKAYTSRVGEGPFISELDTSKDPGKYIQQVGAEFGTTTGRPRRVGWLDLISLKYAVRLNSLTGLAITKMDIIGGLENFNVVIGYEDKNGEKITSPPASIMKIKEYKSILKNFKGWGEKSKEEWLKITKSDGKNLDPKINEFVNFIESFTGCPIYLLSFGPDRKLTLELVKLEEKLAE